MVHIRNAFSHGKIFRDNKNKEIEIKLGKRTFLCSFSNEIFEKLKEGIDNFVKIQRK